MAILSDIVESAKPTQVASGFVFTEGPLWHSDGTLTFVDIRRGQILRLGTDGKTQIIRENSGDSNGMTFDKQGRVIICEMVNRRITRMDPNNVFTVVADKVNGKRLNRPNDVIGKSDGSLYFTNPGRERLEPADVELEHNNVLRVKPDGTVDVIIEKFDYPNGLAFSPNEKILYVANTRPEKYIMAYDVNEDGTVSNGRHFTDMSSEEAGVPDGMKVDAEGRVYCTGPGGCWVFETSGELIGIIKLPEYPANCGWGGPDNKTMYFTANTSVFSRQMKTAGTKIPRA